MIISEYVNSHNTSTYGGARDYVYKVYTFNLQQLTDTSLTDLARMVRGP